MSAVLIVEFILLRKRKSATTGCIKRARAYITRGTVNDVSCFLVAKVLPQTIRSKYEELVVGTEFVDRNGRFWAKDRVGEGFR